MVCWTAAGFSNDLQKFEHRAAEHSMRCLRFKNVEDMDPDKSDNCLQRTKLSSKKLENMKERR